MEDKAEGLMIKSLASAYEPGKRSLSWVKLKKDYVSGLADTLDLVPIGAYEGKGKRTGVFGTFILASKDAITDNWEMVCKIGTGLNDKLLAELNTRFKVLETAPDNYHVPEKLGDVVWIEPTEVWEVKGSEFSLSPVATAGSLILGEEKGVSVRFPRFIKLREDKNIEQATTSQPRKWMALKHSILILNCQTLVNRKLMTCRRAWSW
eukprot:TRINITY_DN13161_c0_g1_i1.p1 TRINITY_DN13161_c0_g1~~TRINITY_DN13161_c0_g1_i1.p1  ORF type:complete len:207 (+),score=37.05 TRINITY_DN13161_c0_g1_i1:187-807(+)